MDRSLFSTVSSTLFSTVILLSSTHAAAEIKVSDRLSLSGFFDMSYANTSSDNDANEGSSLSFDQFEVDLQFNISEGVTAYADIEAGQGESVGGINGIEASLEQAYFTSKIDNALTFKAGRFLSCSGWETEEPTGLLQYSGAYGAQFYGAYQNGVSVLYSAGVVSIAGSVVDDTFGVTDGDGDAEDLGSELMLAFSPSSSLTAKLFFLSDKGAGGETQSNIDAWVSYASGGWTLASEFVTASNAGGVKDVDRSGYLLMANKKLTKQLSATTRYHAWSEENAAGNTTADNSAITVAGLFAINDSWSLIAEVRGDKDDLNSDNDGTTVAFESLMTF